MTNEELNFIYAYARSIWSTFKTPDGEFDGRLHDATWKELLSPYDIDLIVLAMRDYAKSSDFCNIVKVSEICKKMKLMTEGKYVDVETVASEIRKAIAVCNKDETYEKLSDIAKEVVEGPWQLYKWGSMETGQIESVVMSHVRKKISSTLEKRSREQTLTELEAIGYFNKNLLEKKYE